MKTHKELLDWYCAANPPWEWEERKRETRTAIDYRIRMDNGKVQLGFDVAASVYEQGVPYELSRAAHKLLAEAERVGGHPGEWHRKFDLLERAGWEAVREFEAAFRPWAGKEPQVAMYLQDARSPAVIEAVVPAEFNGRWQWLLSEKLFTGDLAHAQSIAWAYAIQSGRKSGMPLTPNELFAYGLQEVVEPDWRPAEAVPEDWYAL